MNFDNLRWGGVSLAIETIIRASGVKRWHIVETRRSQSLAEHSFNVAMLSANMAKVLGLPVAQTALYALEHDLAETFLGDVPTPAKNETQRMMEDAMLREVRVGDAHLSPQCIRLVKVADAADAVRFIKLHGVGQLSTWSLTRMETTLANAIHLLYHHESFDEKQIYNSLTMLVEYAYEAGIEIVAGPVGSTARALARVAAGIGANTSGHI